MKYDSPWKAVGIESSFKDAYTFSIDYPCFMVVYNRPAWWKKLQRWPLTWVLQAMIWLRLTRLKRADQS